MIDQLSVEDRTDLLNKFSKKFGKVIHSKTAQNGSIPLSALLEKGGVKSPEKTILMLRELAESYLTSQVNYYAIVMYHLMDRTGDWTEAGEDRVKLSYTRIMMDVPDDCDVTFTDADQFYQKINEAIQKYQLQSKDIVELQLILHDSVLELFGKIFTSESINQLNSILKMLGSQCRMMLGLSAKFSSFIFGHCHEQQIGEYNVYYLQKEFSRTPNNVLFVVAMIEKKNIFIRTAVCRYVFHSKWKPSLEMDAFDMDSLYADPASLISEAIKKAAIAGYTAKGSEVFIDKIDNFLKDMAENILYHELGHDVLETDQISFTEKSIVNASSVLSENVLTILQEVLAEWVDTVHSLSGPIRNMCNTALLKREAIRAQRMFFIYLSDSWFLDTDTRFMYPYTYIMMALFLPFIKSPTEIDFIALSMALPAIYLKLTMFYKRVLADFVAIIRKSTFYLENNVVNTFAEYEPRVYAGIKAADKKEGIEKTAEQLEGTFWINIFRVMDVHAKQDCTRFQELLSRSQQEFFEILLKDLLVLETDPNLKIIATLEKYVPEKMLALGFE